MHRPTNRRWITAGVALATAGVITVTPVTAPLPNIQLSDIVQLTAAEDMVLDLVRHGQSEDNVSGIIGTVPPGVPLTDTGRDQAVAVGEALYNDGNKDIDGVWASQFIRAQQTAWPLVQLLQGNSSVDPGDIPDGQSVINPGDALPGLDPDQILPGLNELNAGVLEGVNQSNRLVALLYLVAPLAWMFGQYWVPQLGSTIDPNGMAFQDRFSDAVQTIYGGGDTSGDGPLHEVAFSHAAAIATWTMMNVKNPDFEIFFDQLTKGLLSNTGQVIVQGNPTDGWTLISYNGVDVPQDPGLGTELFVDFRDLITAPQMAVWHIWEAILGGDPTTTTNAIQNGFNDVLGAIVQFPQSVISDILGALQDGSGGAGGQVSGELGAAFADAVGSI